MSLNTVLLRSIIFSFPIFFIAFINYIYSVQFYSFDNDATASYYGMGLSWINGIYPKLYFHQPAYFFQELTALLVIFSDYSEVNLVTFNNLGILVNIIFIIISAIWISFISLKLNVSTLSIFLIGLIFASFPTTLLCMSIWTFNIPIIFFLAPISLTYFYHLNNQEFSQTSSNLFYLGVGFIVANYFLGLVILFIIILEKALKKIFLQVKLSDEGILFNKTRFLLYLKIFLPLLIISLSWISQYFLEFTDILFRQLYILFIANFLLIYFLYLIYLRKFIRKDPIALLLTGWSIGTNLFAIPWIYSFYLSYFSVGGTGQELVIENYTNLIQFFQFNIWHLLILFTFVVLLFHLILLKDKKNFLVPLLLISIIVINTILVSPVIFNITENYESFYRIGLSSRYFIISLVPITCIVLLLQKYSIIVKSLSLIFCFIISSVSIGYYTNNLPEHISKIELSVAQLQNYIDNLEEEKARVIFIESYYPVDAAELYAINKNVSSKSKIYNRSYYKKYNEYMTQDDILNIDYKDKNIYYVHHFNLGNSFEIIKNFNDINIFISKLK